MHKFKAYRTFEDDNVVSSRFVEMTPEELDPGEVLVAHEVLDDQLQGRALVQRHRQDHAQVSRPWAGSTWPARWRARSTRASSAATR